MRVSALARAYSPYYGWWIVAVVFVAAALTVGSAQYAFGVFVGPLEETFRWSRTQISASLSFNAVGSLAAPLVGRVMDRHGARPVMVVCLSLMGLSYFLRPLMSELWHWYALSFLQYIGFSGAAALPAGRLIGIWFPRTRGRVMGTATMGNNFGGLTVAPAVGLILAATSWRGAYLAMGMGAFLVALVAALVVREDPGRHSAGPERASMPRGEARAQARPVLTGWTVKQALRSRVFYVITLVVLLGTFTYSTVLPQVTAHLTSIGFSLSTASLMLSALAGAGLTGKMVFGYLAERITARYAMMLSLGGQAIGLMLLSTASSHTVLWLAVPAFGLCMGAFGALFPLIVQETFGIRYFGSIMGLVNMATVVSFTAGPLLAGSSFDTTGGYRLAFLIVAAMFAAGVLVLTQVRQPRQQE